jgi:dihydrodipicolinate synthase/N-acetylneuraminate lyase
MGLKLLPKGVIVDVVTPLFPDNSLDTKTYTRILKHVLKDAQMILIASPRKGQGTSLDITTRLKMLELSLGLIDNTKIVFFYITLVRSEDVFKIIYELNNFDKNNNLKDTIVLTDAPLYYHSNRGLVDLYKVMTSLTKFSFCLYNDPKLIAHLNVILKRQNIRTSILKDLAKMDEILGIISYGSFLRINNYEKAVRFRPEFRVYEGEELRFADFPNRSGVVSALANISPKTWQLIANYSLGLDRFDEGAGLEAQLFRLVQEAKAMAQYLEIPDSQLLEKILAEIPLDKG